MSNFHKVADALGINEVSGKDKYAAHCPVHKDGTASLTVFHNSDGSVQFKCHAGCDSDDIARHVGYENVRHMNSFKGSGPEQPISALSRVEPDTTPREPTKIGKSSLDDLVKEVFRIRKESKVIRLDPETWVYRDKEGEPLFAVARADEYVTCKEDESERSLPRRNGPDTYVKRNIGKKGKVSKTFRQLSHSNGKWYPENLNTVNPLYNLQDINQMKTVLIVEGEKCVEAISKYLPTIAVTTCPGGSQSVNKADWSVLLGKKVYIWADDDTPGRKMQSSIIKHFSGNISAPLSVYTVINNSDGEDGRDCFDVITEMKEDGYSTEKIQKSLKSLLDKSERVNIRSGIGRIGNRLPETAPLPLDALPDALVPYMQWFQRNQGATPDFVAAAFYGAAGGALGHRILASDYIPERGDPWLICPVIWGLCIGEPGGGKSMSMNVGVKCLSLFDKKRRVRFDEEKKEIDQAISERKRKKKDILKMGEYPEKTLDDLPPGPVICGSGSIQGLCESLKNSDRGCFVYRDEFNTLLPWLNENPDIRGIVMSCWNGLETITFEYKNYPINLIEKGTLSILSSSQPETVAPMFCVSEEKSAGGWVNDGASDRFQVVVFPDPAEYPKDTTADGRMRRDNMDEEVELNYKKSCNRLLYLDSSMVGQDVVRDETVHRVVPLTPEALSLYESWKRGHSRFTDKKSVFETKVDKAINQRLKKMGALVMSLSLINHIADVGRGNIGVRSVKKAIKYVEYLKTHIAKMITSSIITSNFSRTIANMIWNREIPEKFTVGEVDVAIKEGMYQRTSRSAIKSALETLIDIGWLSIDPLDSKSYSVNRLVYTLTEDQLTKVPEEAPEFPRYWDMEDALFDGEIPPQEEEPCESFNTEYDLHYPETVEANKETAAITSTDQHSNYRSEFSDFSGDAFS